MGCFWYVWAGTIAPSGIRSAYYRQAPGRFEAIQLCRGAASTLAYTTGGTSWARVEETCTGQGITYPFSCEWTRTGRFPWSWSYAER